MRKKLLLAAFLGLSLGIMACGQLDIPLPNEFTAAATAEESEEDTEAPDESEEEIAESAEGETDKNADTDDAADAAGSDEVTEPGTGISQGLGVVSNGRIGPGKDDKDVSVYSFNEVIAYVLFDEDGRILDLETDILEVATPNYDGEHMPVLTGFPGQEYNADTDHDGKVDELALQTEENFLSQVEAWATKRERGDTYKLGSGDWATEMDIFEDAFKGMSIEELKDWFAKYCSDVNGRVLNGTSQNEEDIAKYEALSDEEKEALADAVSGATMSLSDAHGNMIGAIEKAYENRRPVKEGEIAKIGLGVTNTGRVGPGKDDQEVSVYSFNTQLVGAVFDKDGKYVDMTADIMEVATPNYDGATMPKLTGFPEQAYNADEDSDGKVDIVLTQTEEDFLPQVDAWRTKRERGDTYQLGSGSWAEEMDIYEDAFRGLTKDELGECFEKLFSDLNGRPLNGKSEAEEDVAKREALSEEEIEAIDGLSGATMSLRDAHGDMIGAILEACDNAKDFPDSAE